MKGRHYLRSIVRPTMEETMTTLAPSKEFLSTHRDLGCPDAWETWQKAISEHFRVHRLHDEGRATDAEKRKADTAMLYAYDAWLKSIPAA
jgi:hypothetical protein